MKMFKAVVNCFNVLPKCHTVQRMHVTEINDHIHLIDLEVAGIENTIASYVIKGKNTTIVETGPASTAQNLLSGLKQLNVKLEQVAYVAVSHIHLDHAGAAGTLLKHLPKAKLIVHPRGAPHVANPEKLWTEAREVLGNKAEMYGKPEPVPEKRIVAAADGMTLNVGNGVSLKVVETLGHASHHLSYYETLNEGIFTGDAAGIYLNRFGVVVPTTPPPLRLDIALASLKKLISLKPRFLYYSHFGKAENGVKKLQAYAKQLELWAQIARQGVEEGESLDAISRRLLESDAAVRKAARHIESHPIFGTTVLNQSVEGVVRFVEKFGNVVE